MPARRLQVTNDVTMEPAQCEQVLETLVTDGALWTNGREYFGPDVGQRLA